MRNLRNLFAAFALTAVLMFGTVGANAGIIIAGAVEEDPCTEKTETSFKDGIIIAGATGIIIAGFTGIIIAGAAEEPTADCGIIIAG